MDSSNCAIWCLKQSLCICVWKMCLLLHIIIQIWWKMDIILKFFQCSSLTFSFKKFDYSKMDSSNCAIRCLKQSLCICVWKMCLLLYIITHTLRNWHLLWTTFHFDFLSISTKTFFSHKNNHCSYLILYGPINNIHLHLLYKSEHIKFPRDQEIWFQS